MSMMMKIILVTVVVGGLAAVAVIFPSASQLDFSHLRYGLRPVTSEETGSAPPVASAPDLLDEDTQVQHRESVVNQARASYYLDSATRDYYQGSFEDALRRLDRAKIYDPTNFGVYKLSGQIFFERSEFRKAFNDWARATQLPNDDKALSRDLDVLKRLIRYGRNETDRLRRSVNRNPDDRLSAARLREIENQLTD
jgi:tetratricopeptide (TPR) repeat protein